MTFTIFSHSVSCFSFCSAIFLKFHFLTFATGLLPVETVNHKRVVGGEGRVRGYHVYIVVFVLFAFIVIVGSSSRLGVCLSCCCLTGHRRVLKGGGGCLVDRGVAVQAWPFSNCLSAAGFVYKDID